MEVDLWQLKNIIRATAKEVVQEMMIQQNPTSDEITESQAYKEFGEGWLDHQKMIGAVKWVRKGAHKNSPKIYSRKQLNELKYGPDSLLMAISNK